MPPPLTFLGEFEHMVLATIMRLGTQAYGGAVLAELHLRTGRTTSSGALYVTLDRLEAKGYLRSRPGPPGAARGGRPKRMLAVTAAGARAVRDQRAAFLNLWDGLEKQLERS